MPRRMRRKEEAQEQPDADQRHLPVAEGKDHADVTAAVRRKDKRHRNPRNSEGRQRVCLSHHPLTGDPYQHHDTGAHDRGLEACEHHIKEDDRICQRIIDIMLSDHPFEEPKAHHTQDREMHSRYNNIIRSPAVPKVISDLLIQRIFIAQQDRLAQVRFLFRQKVIQSVTHRLS